ncbi:MAG: phage major capsid protein, partial [Pseudomonadota bacterium]
MPEEQETGTAAETAGAILENPDFQKTIADLVGSSVASAIKELTDNAQPNSPGSKLFTPGVNTGQDDRDQRKGTQKLAAMVGFFHDAHRRTGSFAPDYAEKIAEERGDKHIAKAINTIDFGEGGALVPTHYVDDIFEELRPVSALRQMPITVIDMVDGNAVLPGITNGATAGYKGEKQVANASSVGTGDIRFVEKELICIVPLTASMMRSRGGRNSTAISNSMIRAMAQAEGYNLLNGNGSGNTPDGILNRIPAAQKTASAGDSLADIDNDKKALQSTVRGFNVPVTRETGGYLMDTTIEESLMALRSGDVKAFPEMENGRYGVYRYAGDNNMPDGVKLFGHWPDVILAESDQIEFTVSTEAA